MGGGECGIARAVPATARRELRAVSLLRANAERHLKELLLSTRKYKSANGEIKHAIVRREINRHLA